MTRNASCSCGQLSVTVEGEPVRISMCHCLDCQRRTGSVFAAQAWFPRINFVSQGRCSRFERKADSGSRLTYSFCPSCGATVFYENEAMPDWTAVPIGVFADPSFPAPRVSVYESRKHTWVSTPPNAERLD